MRSQFHEDKADRFWDKTHFPGYSYRDKEEPGELKERHSVFGGFQFIHAVVASSPYSKWGSDPAATPMASFQPAVSPLTGSHEQERPHLPSF
jgi:hypothetical protein